MIVSFYVAPENTTKTKTGTRKGKTMANEGEIYKCNLCGNVVFVLESGDGDLVCCGEEMHLLSGDDRKPFEGRLPKPGSP